MTERCPGVFDLTWRMTQAQVQEIINTKPWTIRGQTQNKAAIGIAGGEFVGFAISVVNFLFYDDQLCRVDIYFLDLAENQIGERYDELKRVLVKEYGEPTADSRESGASGSGKGIYSDTWNLDEGRHKVELDVGDRSEIILTYADVELDAKRSEREQIEHADD